MLANVKRAVFKLMVAVLTTTVAVVVAGGVARGADVPSGERALGQSVIEPAYNDANGSIVYLLTPINAHINPNDHNTAPLYVIMYPTSAASTIGTVNCSHQPGDNCPDHGPELAGLAKATVPSVYGGGVWGHDHILAAPASGGDFNVNWEPIAVMFNSTAAITHITTLTQLTQLPTGAVTEIPLPAATFHCSVVAAATYNRGTPVTPAPPLP